MQEFLKEKKTSSRDFLKDEINYIYYLLKESASRIQNPSSLIL